MSRSRLAVVVLSVVVPVLVLVVAKEAVSCCRLRSPYRIHGLPLWDITRDRGFVLPVTVDATRPFRYPRTFPIVVKAQGEKQLVLYPAAYCTKCRRPFAFVVKRYRPGTAPGRCPLCGAEGPGRVRILTSVEEVFRLGLESAFAPPSRPPAAGGEREKEKEEQVRNACPAAP